jgi:hypothetical protein
MTKETLKKAIAAANTGQRFHALGLVRADPGMAAVISKLIPDRMPAQYDQRGNREQIAPNIGVFNQLSDKTTQSITDAQTVMQLLPDMELAAQILVSSILSPKDMMTTELTYSITEGLLPPDISAAMLEVARKGFEQDYKIKQLLPQMLRDILFETGSYAIAVIPENSIDEVINGTNRVAYEDLSEHINQIDGSVKPIGLLGPAVRSKPTTARLAGGLAMEALENYEAKLDIDCRVTLEGILPNKVDTYLTVTDNHTLLKIPQLNQKIREERIRNNLGSKAMESLSIKNKLNDRELTSLMYKDRQFQFKPIGQLKTQEQLNRRTVGNPLVLHLPSESVIPVYVPGCVEEQVGFFVLIDADGNPVSKAENVDHYRELSQRLNSNGSFPSAMLGRVKSMMSGFDHNNNGHLDYTARAYGGMVEQDLLARLRNGVYGNGVALAKKEEVYRIMFARALAKQHTQLLFVPVELMTYMAFKFTSDGVGKSLLEDMKILNSLRSMLMFANVMASLKNSIGRTEVKLKLDESDPNPQKTIEIAMHEIIRSRQQYFPLGMNSPTDLTDWLQRSGFEFTFEGHPGIPDVAVDFGQKSDTHVKPDTELEESLRKRAIMATGLSPETVDASFQTEFATSIMQNNILLSKRVMRMQEQFTPQVSDSLRKFMMHSESMQNDLRSILENNFDKLNLELTESAKIKAAELNEIRKRNANNTEVAQESLDQYAMETNQPIDGVAAREKEHIVTEFLNQFIMNFEVSLPKPNSVTLENQMTALKTYKEALDAALDAYISEEFFTESTGGEIASEVTAIKAVLKAYYVRQWMAENGMLTEISSLTNVNSKGLPAVDVYQIQQSHIQNLTKALTRFMVNLKPVKDASDKVVNAMGGVDNDSGNESGSDDFTSGDGGDGDFGLDDPDTPSDEVTAEAPTEKEPKEGEESTTTPVDDDKPEEPKQDGDTSDDDTPKI